MKSFKFAAIFFCFCLSEFVAVAQVTEQLNFGIPLYKHSPYGKTFGFMVLFPAFKTLRGDERLSTEFRLGADYDMSIGKEVKIQNIPMADPAGSLTDAEAKTSAYKLNLVGRFSRSYEEILVPYFDVFAGWRNYNSRISYTPHDSGVYVPGGKFYKANRFNFGGTAGLMISLGPCIKLDAGITVSCLGAPVRMPDLNHSYMENGALTFNRTPASNYTAMFRFGVTIVFNEELSNALSFMDGCFGGCTFGGGGGSRSRSSGGGGSSGGHRGGVNIHVK